MCASDSTRRSDPERLMNRLNTNQPSKIAPSANVESPIIRIQRNLSIKPVCKNSDDRAYHVPYSTDAQVCIRPIGSRLINTIRARPMLIAQNELAIGQVFHC